jgi:hypothetical protein
MERQRTEIYRFQFSEQKRHKKRCNNGYMEVSRMVKQLNYRPSISKNATDTENYRPCHRGDLQGQSKHASNNLARL